MLFTNHCAGCGTRIDTYALDRLGTLPTVFCDGVCETNYRNKKSMVTEKVITHQYDKRFQGHKPLLLNMDKHYDITTGKVI